MKKCYLMIDVGGTGIKVNSIEADGGLIFNENKHYPSRSDGSKEIILENLKQILLTNYDVLSEMRYDIAGIGIAFPGPFDYENGVSLIKGLRKYDAIYGVNLKVEIDNWLKEAFSISLPVIFENDATAFGLGEFYHLKEKVRGIGITLGTGCGSSFIEDNRICRIGYGLNDQGMIYDTPFKNGVIDDYLSSKGLSFIQESLGEVPLSGAELFLLASRGDKNAYDIFEKFGELIGEALLPFIERFSPDELVFGGEIAGSYHFFKKGVLRVIGDHNLKTRVTQNTSLATYKGLYYLIQTKSKEC
ncbi:ROK family protein [Vagococcus sp. PNs007]|uniref:ROK family protein n=1 Tax=Vagococcus proximus TaxID=2991417 RepID=A0ABT5X1X4_9ENTE|nr:ROK family protein [Vagococcus proximus]MDF0480002.1 ROK family protein [Vagococcus proximus]